MSKTFAGTVDVKHSAAIVIHIDLIHPETDVVAINVGFNAALTVSIFDFAFGTLGVFGTDT